MSNEMIKVINEDTRECFFCEYCCFKAFTSDTDEEFDDTVIQEVDGVKQVILKYYEFFWLEESVNFLRRKEKQ